MLKFTSEELEKFKKFQNIKENSGEIEKKLIDKTIKYIKYVKWIPGLKMIAIGNSVAMNSANNESDIDLFIVTAPNRLWIARILITFIFQILGVRKTNKFHKERFCLSFFCTTNALNFENIAIENDIYLYNWIFYLKPILNYDSTYEKFINENSKWIDITIQSNKYKIQNNKNEKNIFLDSLEQIIKSIFLPKTKKTFERLGRPFGVIINNEMLKFHNNDKRIEIRDKLIG
nr:hypothetical protein [Candidatus Gracilibacteria bacterium]